MSFRSPRQGEMASLSDLPPGASCNCVRACALLCGCTQDYAHTDVSPPKKFQISRRNVDVCIDHLECACTNQHTRQRPPFELHLQVPFGRSIDAVEGNVRKTSLVSRVQTRFEITNRKSHLRISGRPCRSCLDLPTHGKEPASILAY